MITDKWVKIGEVTKTGGIFKCLYCTYAVFEYIESNGLRKYKEVYMASDAYNKPNIKSQEN